MSSRQDSQGMVKLINRGLEELGLGGTPDRAELILKYINELERWNRIYGFVKAEGCELVSRHVLDSLSAVATIKSLEHHGSICDLGSGAGFPGIPLAMFLTESELVLIERAARRAAFLRNTAILLGLKNVRVIEKDFRHIKERYPLVTFRALSPLARELKNLKKITAEGGKVVAYKGRLERILPELSALHQQISHFTIRRVKVPFLFEERHLVIFSP